MQHRMDLTSVARSRWIHGSVYSSVPHCAKFNRPSKPTAFLFENKIKINSLLLCNLPSLSFGSANENLGQEMVLHLRCRQHMLNILTKGVKLRKVVDELIHQTERP